MQTTKAGIGVFLILVIVLLSTFLAGAIWLSALKYNWLGFAEITQAWQLVAFAALLLVLIGLACVIARKLRGASRRILKILADELD